MRSPLFLQIGLVYNICYVRTKNIQNKNHTKMDGMAITCVNRNKKENTCINKICFQRQKKKEKKDYINFCYPTNEKERNYGLSFIWSLDLEALSVVSGGTSLSLFLDALPMGRIVKTKSFSKPTEVAPG